VTSPLGGSNPSGSATKEFAVSRHQPFGKTSNYVKCIENADFAKMAKLIKLVGMLLQNKVSLFWKKKSLYYL
jgi:hypothetical protein